MHGQKNIKTGRITWLPKDGILKPAASQGVLVQQVLFVGPLWKTLILRHQFVPVLMLTHFSVITLQHELCS